MRLIVPYISKKFKNSCSECCAEMVLKYYEIYNLNQNKIHEMGYTIYENLNGLFESQGLIVYYKIGNTIDELKYYLDMRVPIIVRIYNSNEHKDLHTILLIGYNENGFYYHDNELGSNKIFLFNKFINDWTGKYIIVMKNKESKILKINKQK